MKFAAVVMILGLFGACASGSNRDCDPSTEICSCSVDAECPGDYVCDARGTCTLPGQVDAAPPAPIDAAAPMIDAAPVADAGSPPPDAIPLAGFGEPCDDKSQCASNICVFTSAGGVCTDFCSGDDCPDEYGCFAIGGVVEPGVVDEVCVPEFDQLCTACVDDSECGLLGTGACLEYDNGAKFCARDCAVESCPTGYQCQTVSVDSGDGSGTLVDLEQCVPASGACDCNATFEGNTEGCTLATPFGSCDGTRTCQGAGGWGQCEPPSPTDRPDGNFFDANCDGIDGDRALAIFVSDSAGSDTSECGTDYDVPCASIAHGILRALSTPGRSEVYIQAGEYREVVVMKDGIHLYGGYDTSWQRGDHSDFDHQVRIFGGKDDSSGGDGQYLVVRAHGLVVETTLADVKLFGPQAGGRDNGLGRSSYGLHVEDARLRVERVTVQAGNGSSGGTGGNGSNAPTLVPTADMLGETGGSGGQGAALCNDSQRGRAGLPGTNFCAGGAVAPGGGLAGRGGTKDDDCPFGWDATPGLIGEAAASSPGAAGDPGGGGPVCQNGLRGNDGTFANGAAGAAAVAGGSLLSGYWYANAGGTGGLGDHGSGGGGGGGGGGCDDGIDAYGSGGGGGGAGGCRALGGGTGGGGGGGSFGIFAVDGSEVTAVQCTIIRGGGGNGGGGGLGGQGQSGGPGGDGGFDANAPNGGAGGDGGHGGHGGGGGGGAGGDSVGVFINSGDGTVMTHDCSVEAGSGGNGGSGGPSAPSAPVSERDGEDGEPGPDGRVFAVCVGVDGCS